MNPTRYLKARNSTRQLPNRESFVCVQQNSCASEIHPLQIALWTIKLARLFGVSQQPISNGIKLPYDPKHDGIVFDAPLLSYLTGANLHFLRGWKQYQSCIKGFNAFGLIAEIIINELTKIESFTPEQYTALTRSFLTTRQSNGIKAFNDEEISDLLKNPLLIDKQHLAIWSALSQRTIVCSTSSNMGISLHEILRYMQTIPQDIGNKKIPVLTPEEGHIIIWCPDEEADFMNAEKSALLRSLEAEKPALTTLHTYINRRQRDPGALQDALKLGGYFFPTNPQSREELQNLLANSLKNMATTRGCFEIDLLEDTKILQTLNTLGCKISDNRIFVSKGIESGMFGLMAPYLLMLEETLATREIPLAISTWNQASIGAALAAAVLADELLRDVERIPPDTRKELQKMLPTLSHWLSRNKLGKNLKTRIHGVFDLANLQSLAQLLGVVVERHLSGRGIAYVGLGSSSYANGNSCFDILSTCMRKGGAFHGKSTFHPATHTINPVAQALIVSEEMLRASTAVSNGQISQLEAVRYIRKPEPAGAAALAGYMLARLDSDSLSIAEIAYTLKLAGFDRDLFLKFIDMEPSDEGANWFIQEASEEGDLMEGFAHYLLDFLDYDIDELSQIAANERTQSQNNQIDTPLVPPDFEALEPIINIYLTGDNTKQPVPDLLTELMSNMQENKQKILTLLQDRSKGRSKTAAQTTLFDWSNNGTGELDITGLIADIFRRNQHNTFIIDHINGSNWTYGQFQQAAQSAALHLQNLGLQKGDRIATLLPNGIPLAAIYFASLLTGIISVPINPDLPPSEVEQIIRLSRVQHLVIDASITSMDPNQTPSLHELSQTQVFSPYPIGTREPTTAQSHTWSPEISASQETRFPLVTTRPNDIFLILFTSGTTSIPKGVAHTLASELGNAIAYNAAVGLNSESRVCHLWPMAYSSGILNTLLSPFIAEASVVLVPPFNARSVLSFWQPILQHQINTLWLSPTMITALLTIDRDQTGIDYCRRNMRLIACGTAPLPESIRQKFHKKYGKPLMESYGLTETLILTTQMPRFSDHHSAGKALTGVDIRIAREDELSLQSGGEILVNTPYAMYGYLAPETGEIQWNPPGSYFSTGDLGHFDADGNLHITGRKKDLIIRGGQTISPASVRDALLASASVEEAVVVGLPNSFYGEEVAAAIKLRPGVNLKEVQRDIIAECTRRLHPSSVPTVLHAVTDFPLGSSGKILSHKVKKLLSDLYPPKT